MFVTDAYLSIFIDDSSDSEEVDINKCCACNLNGLLISSYFSIIISSIDFILYSYESGKFVKGIDKI